eukprot:gene15173-20439_t
MSKNNTSGIKGVCFDSNANKWKAYIRLDGILIHLGLFDNIEDAKQARVNKANEVFGEFINDCSRRVSSAISSAALILREGCGGKGE